MVSIRRLTTPVPASRLEASPPSPEATALPRAMLHEVPKAEPPASFLGKLWSFLRSERAGAAVLLGATALGTLSGCATSGRVARVENPYDQLGDAQAKWASYQEKVTALNAKSGELSHTALAAARAQLYQEYVDGGGTIGVGGDEDADGLDLAREILFGTDPAKLDTDGDLMGDGYEVRKGLNPTSPQASAKADVAGWTHGYIPMSGNPMIEGDGLYAYDMLMKDRTGKDPKTRHIEGRSALDGGHYFLSGVLDEKNAELTAAKDFNGDGVLTPGVEIDFLSPGAAEARFGADGKKSLTLDVAWWGHCNDVAIAGIKFKEPTKPVSFKLAKAFDRYTVSTTHGTFHAESVKVGSTHTDLKLLSGQTVRLANGEVQSTSKKSVDEVTFTPDQIKELLSELVHRGSKEGSDFIGSRYYGRDATIHLKDGTKVVGGLVSSLDDRATLSGTDHVSATGFTKPVSVRVFNFEAGAFETKTYEAAEISKIEAENQRDVAPITFHETMLKWIGSDGKAGVMDKDAGPHVWNYSFDRYELESKPRAGAPSTLDYEMKVYFSGNSWPTTYNYSISYEHGVPKSGTWAESSPNPDFFWNDRGGHEAYDHAPTSKATPIAYSVVMELYAKSIAP